MRRSVEIPLKVDVLPGHIDYQPVHSQKYLCSRIIELEMYLILVDIKWDTVWVFCQNSAYLPWLGGQTIPCCNQAILP